MATADPPSADQLHALLAAIAGPDPAAAQRLLEADARLARGHDAQGITPLMVAAERGRPAVVEYSELSEEMKVATDRKGRLLYSAAHICINYFSIPFIRRFVDDELVRRAPPPCHPPPQPCV